MPSLVLANTWRNIPVSRWLRTMVIVSTLSRVVGWGWSLITYESWDDPPSRSPFFLKKQPRTCQLLASHKPLEILVIHVFIPKNALKNTVIFHFRHYHELASICWFSHLICKWIGHEFAVLTMLMSMFFFLSIRLGKHRFIRSFRNDPGLSKWEVGNAKGL